MNGISGCIRNRIPLTTVAFCEEKLAFSDLKSGDVSLPWVQGGCCDGQYMYQFMISKDSEHCIIVKYDMATQEFVDCSEDLPLGHANDGAYNPYDNTIAITHCLDAATKLEKSNRIYIVDANDLILLRSYDLPKSELFAIAYNPNTRQYITAGEEEMNYWDEEFNLIDTKAIFMTPGWPSQGIDCDGEFVYRLEFFIRKNEEGVTVEMKNNIHVNDVQNGEELALIPLNVGLESENMFMYDGKFYVACNNRAWSGCTVYGFEFVPESGKGR